MASVHSSDGRTIENWKKSVVGFYQLKKLRRSQTFPSSLFDIDLLLIAPDTWNDADKAEANRIL